MSEHVVLADCKDKNGILSSEIAYYNSSGAGTPQDVATVATDSGQTALWVCDNTTALFTDTNTQFVAKLGPKVADGQYAGTGDNGYHNGGFRCWQTFSKNYYTYGSTTCNMVYNCNHEAAPTNTATAVCGVSTALATPSTSGSAGSSNASTSELSTGAVIGVSVGVGVAVVVAAITAFLMWRYMRTKRRRQQSSELADGQVTVDDFSGMYKSPVLATPQGYRQGPPQPSHELEAQDRIEISGPNIPGELGGNARAEMATPESQYYMWYPIQGGEANSPLEGPPARQ